MVEVTVLLAVQSADKLAVNRSTEKRFALVGILVGAYLPSTVRLIHNMPKYVHIKW